MLPRTLGAVLLAGGLVALSACDADSEFDVPDDTFVEGETVGYLGGEVTSWGLLDGDGEVVAAGVTLPLAVVENARPAEGPPPDGPPVVDPDNILTIGFPEEVTSASFVDHMTFHWEPGGHPPVGVFTLPHFDMHLFAISVEEEHAIDCTNLTGTPEALVPEGHGVADPGFPPDGECVPAMGQHAVDLTDPVFNPDDPETFRRTMILGYYGGTFNFVEPMITQELLLSREDFDMDIPLPETTGRDTMIPTRFEADYNEDDDSYDLVFTDFVQAP